MRRFISAVIGVLLLLSLVGAGLAAPDAPEITLQPQSPCYPEYSVAMYTVKASGTNLMATWYMEWQGQTYTISLIDDTQQPWEGYTSGSYGARQLDENTFIYVFEGIGRELDGAYIWCVLEDGHYDVTSQRTRITVGDYGSPPVILEIPAELTVEQGAEAEIRCIAQSPGEQQLSFLWYETTTGRMEDMQAINRGEETTDYLLCDTSRIGTRNYLCMVETSEGGRIYSSIVPVTVTEKAPETTQAPETTTPETNATIPAGETTPETTASTPETQPVTTTAPTVSTTTPTISATEPQVDEVDGAGIPWWGLTLIGVGGVGAGIGAAFILTPRKPKV